jgi:hypothetical protein
MPITADEQRARLFEEHIRKGLESVVSRVADKVLTEAHQELERKIRERVAEIAVSIAREANIVWHQDEVVVRVKFDGGVR